MLRRRWIFTVTMGLGIALASCASKDFGVSTSSDPLTRFPSAATFAWDDRTGSLPTDPRLQELELGPLIREVVEIEFAVRNYRAAGRATANYRLSYELGVLTRTGVDRSTAVASFSLQLAEAASRRRVWTGFARAPVHVGLTRGERKERLHRVIAEMLKDFPPSHRGE